MIQAIKVSVIIPTHNRSSMLKRAALSVLRQTYKNLECIIVDDASTDDTPDVIRELIALDERIKSTRHESNRFGAAGRNTGVRISSGEFIAFLDDDDQWFPEKLEKQMALFSSLPDAFGLIYCWMDYYNPQGRLVRQHHPVLRGDVFQHVLTGNKIGGTPTLLIRKRILDESGGWDESQRIQQDDILIVRLCRITRVELIPEVLVRVNTGHGRQISRPGANAAACWNGIRALETLLLMALEAGPAYKRQAAVLHARLGNAYARVGEIAKSLSSFHQAFYSSPFEWENIHMLLSLAKWRLIGRRR
jgi:glycosyltransferase involved in cell wall biosynthesis